MPRDARAFLWDVRQAADNIAAFIRGKTEQAYAKDELLHSAVERQLEIIGEALNQLDKSAPKAAARIPHLRRIVGLRSISHPWVRGREARLDLAQRSGRPPPASCDRGRPAQGVGRARVRLGDGVFRT
jgi:uncharacterized protein with HEPN domain